MLFSICWQQIWGNRADLQHLYMWQWCSAHQRDWFCTRFSLVSQIQHPDHACGSELLEKLVLDLDCYTSARGRRASGAHLETKWGLASKLHCSSEPKYSASPRQEKNLTPESNQSSCQGITYRHWREKICQGGIKKAQCLKGVFSVSLKLPGSFMKIWLENSN